MTQDALRGKLARINWLYRLCWQGMMQTIGQQQQLPQLIGCLIMFVAVDPRLPTLEHPVLVLDSGCSGLSARHLSETERTDLRRESNHGHRLTRIAWPLDATHLWAARVFTWCIWIVPWSIGSSKESSTGFCLLWPSATGRGAMLDRLLEG